MTKRKPKEEHKPTGRPTAYEGEKTDVLVKKFALLGGKDSIIAEFLGVSEVTLNAWKTKHPSFLKALNEGKHEADADIANSLYHRAK